jgi:hypothetical protein
MTDESRHPLHGDSRTAPRPQPRGTKPMFMLQWLTCQMMQALGDDYGINTLCELTVASISWPVHDHEPWGWA